MSRQWTLRKPCVHPGCTEVARYTYDTRREMVESFESRHDYRCVRHASPGEVLALDNPQTECVMVSRKSVAGVDKLFWSEPSRSGFTYGNGYKAYADDFPEGTRLIVTARIELPTEPKP